MATIWPLVGRQREFAAMCTAIAESGGVVLTGAAGVGKSRLAREAMELAQYKIVRWVAATATGRPVPWGALAEFVGRCGPDPLRRVQEVIDALAGDEPPMTVLIVVDDAHLLDEHSASVIRQVLDRRIAPVVMTVRDGEIAHEVIASLWESGHLPRIEIPHLTADEVTSLVEYVLGGPLESSSAQRIWSYTRGNVLFLRQLIADESASGGLTRRSGVWIWDGPRRLSASLIELIESSTGHQDDSVIDVLDILAVSDPVELPVLLGLADTAGLDAAVARGLVTVDAVAGMVHLAHPLFGEVRRDRAGTPRLRNLRGRVADAIGTLSSGSPVQLVRRGVLVMDSDGNRDPELLRLAAEAALQLLDLDLAIRLSQCAVQAGGGRPAQLTYALSLGMAGGGSECDEMLAVLMATAEGGELAQIALMRAAILAWNVGKPRAAEEVLDVASDAASACGLAPSFDALRASVWAERGRPSEAVELATTALSGGDLLPLAAMFGHWGLVIGHGDLGQLDSLRAAASGGYDVAQSAPDASHLRFSLGLMEIVGLRLAGAVDATRTVAALLRSQSQDVAPSHAVTAMLMGLAEMSCGDLATARRWFQEALARGATVAGLSGSVCELAGLWLTTALAMAGDRVAAERVYDQVKGIDDDVVLWRTDELLARAWLHAVNGSLSLATAFALDAARAARRYNRPAHEVVCLQTATQFGHVGSVDRLHELAATMQGPRAGAAYAHARALRKGDGPGLLAAAGLYEAFGDRVAAADAAAQAAVVLDKRGQHESSSAAAAMARRIAAESGSNTMTFQAMADSTMLTRRQREVIALAASGLSNREIAARLVMSVRTVEGHLLRASRRTATSTREELVALLRGVTHDPL